MLTVPQTVRFRLTLTMDRVNIMSVKEITILLKK